MPRKFEYSIIFEGVFEKSYNQLGQEGWELVGINQVPNGNTWVNKYVLKREIESSLTRKPEQLGHDIGR
jgi:hypothetical protein